MPTIRGNVPDKSDLVWETFTVRTTPEQVEQVWAVIREIVHGHKR